MTVATERMLIPTLVIALFFWLVRWIASGYTKARTPADYSILLLSCLLLSTILVSPHPSVTLPQVFRVMVGIAFYYAIVNYGTTAKKVLHIHYGMVIIGVGLVVIAPLGVEWITDKIPGFADEIYKSMTMVLADRVHPNVMAGYLLLFFPIALALTTYPYNVPGAWWRCVIAGGAALLMLLVMFLTQSRGAFLALFPVLLLFFLLRWSRYRIQIFSIVATILLVGGFATAIVVVQSPVAWSLLIQSASGRLEIWSRAVWIIQDFPFTGVGMGLYGEVVEALYPLFSFPPGEIPHAHNLFLQIAVDLGIPGLVVWLALVGHIGATSWCSYSHACRNNLHQAKVLATGQLSSGAALLIHGLVDAVTWGMVKPSILVWGIAGTIVATWQVMARDESK